MDRILQSTPTTLSRQFYQDGVAADPGATTYAVTRDDGTSVVSGSAAGATTNPRTINLTTAHTAQLDVLKVVWTTVNLGIATDYAEVVGGYLFSIAEARLREPFDDTTAYSASAIASARTKAEQSLESACRRAFVPRYYKQIIDGTAGGLARMHWPLLRTIRSVVLNGVTTFDSTQLAQLKLRRSGFIYNPGGWLWGVQNYAIAFEHGYDYPPQDAGEMCLRLACHRNKSSTFDERVVMAQAGEELFKFVNPGEQGRFGVPDIDAFVRNLSAPLAA